MNVLKRILIPGLEHTIRYILIELEELEREDTFRLKRVKQNNIKRAKQNGAGERMEIINEEPKIEEDQPDTKPVELEPAKEPDKDDKETENADNKESIHVQPKEAAEMGDLIVIKPADNEPEVGDTNVPQTGLNIALITEAEKAIDLIVEMDEKETIKDIEFVLEKHEGQTQLEDESNEDLEAGEWFETATTMDNKPSEFPRMDNHEDAVGTKVPDDTDDVPDIDNRGLASLYKGIDSNFYKPTIDDLFSKHDIAMKSISNDMSSSYHSLVDLESIDFSLDSQGKVILSRHETDNSSPALSYREVNRPKQAVTYDKAGMLIVPKSSISNLKFQGEGEAEDDLQPLQDKHFGDIKANDADDIVVSRKSTVDDTDQAEDTRESTIDDNDNSSNMATGDVINSRIDVPNTENNMKENEDIKLDDIDGENTVDDFSVNYGNESTNNTDNIPELENETNRVIITEDENLRMMSARILSSIADEQLSKISEEENVDPQDITEVGKVVEHHPSKVNEIKQHIQTISKDNIIQENFKPVTSARSSRDLQLNINSQIIDKETVLNPIAEENEVLKYVTQNKTLEHQLREAMNEVSEDTTVQNLNDTDLENRALKIRDSTEITKVIDVSKQTTSQMEYAEDINKSIQIKRKSQVRQLENKLTINTSDEMIERDDNLKGNNQSTDENEKQKEDTEKDLEQKETDNESDDKGSPSNDKQERHSGDDHLKQD